MKAVIALFCLSAFFSIFHIVKLLYRDLKKTNNYNTYEKGISFMCGINIWV